MSRFGERTGLDEILGDACPNGDYPLTAHNTRASQQPKHDSRNPEDKHNR
jgi:hypothetical protein